MFPISNSQNLASFFVPGSHLFFLLQNNVDLIDREKAEKNQNIFANMLHRYLCSSIGKPNAIKLLPRYIKMLSELEEMAQIMISKRLLY